MDWIQPVASYDERAYKYRITTSSLRSIWKGAILRVSHIWQECPPDIRKYIVCRRHSVKLFQTSSDHRREEDESRRREGTAWIVGFWKRCPEGLRNFFANKDYNYALPVRQDVGTTIAEP